jgi:hypothetical protein
MSLTIAIQACCQVFQISYEELLTVDRDRQGYILTWFSTERKFAAYYLNRHTNLRHVGLLMNVSYVAITAYVKCISELIEENPENMKVIYMLEEKYNQIKAKQIAS